MQTQDRAIRHAGRISHFSLTQSQHDNTLLIRVVGGGALRVTARGSQSVNAKPKARLSDVTALESAPCEYRIDHRLS